MVQRVQMPPFRPDTRAPHGAKYGWGGATRSSPKVIPTRDSPGPGKSSVSQPVSLSQVQFGCGLSLTAIR